MCKTLVCAAISLALASAALAGEIPLQNLPSAQFKPGSLKLPLTVHERGNVARQGVVVTSGVPFPPGFLPDVGKLGVVDKDGRPVPSQSSLMVKWHKPAYDDSVQWALVSFVCDVPASGTSTYYLTDDGQPAPGGAPIQLVRGEQAITVRDGPATFIVPMSGAALISSATLGDVRIIGGEGLRGVIRGGEWADRNLKADSLQKATHRAADVVIEESGPVRCVIAIKGTYAPGDSDGQFYQFTARLYFEQASPSVRIVYTIANSSLDVPLIKGLRHLYVWPIKDASLVADLTLGDHAQVSTLAEGKIVSSGAELLVNQDSSGGAHWRDLPLNKNGQVDGYAKWLSGYTGGKTVRGVSFRGYKVSAGGRELAGGDGHQGVIDVAGNGGITAALRNFRVEYPHSLAASGKSLRIGLFPGEFSEPFALRNGQRKSWDIRLTLRSPAQSTPAQSTPADATHRLEQAFGVEDTLLLFRPDPAWMVRAGAAGAWPYGIALLKDPAAGHAARLDKDKLDGINAGWDWYGWISSWNAGGGHWNEETQTLPWVLYGDGANFDDAERKTLWFADLTAIHFDHPDMGAWWNLLRGFRDTDNRVVRAAYGGYYDRDTWGVPDSGHMGMVMLAEYYFLTGDMRAREAIEHLGQRARAMLWEYTHDDRADGTGPTVGANKACRKRDPDKEPDFMLYNRYVGWPLYDLANWYRFSGDPALLEECRTIALAFRNTARYSPIGFMCLYINDKGNDAMYGHQGPFDKNRALSASQCYAHFQMGLMTTGLIEYYLMSRDDEALDAMVGFADCLTHHAMIRDPNGKEVGWTYAFGDYWGPYTWDDLGPGHATSWHVSNFVCTEDLGWIEQFTGRADYAQAVKDAGQYTGSMIFWEAAALQAGLHPKVDGRLPAAITDLAGRNSAAGKVELTWTAPARQGGTVQRYRVKYSTADIVEFVKGWPDRTEPLPADKKEWESRATAFNSRQRAFWAANTALNPPHPRPAGAAETMVIQNLPPGTYHFAIKSFDDCDNLSLLSNVLQVTVK